MSIITKAFVIFLCRQVIQAAVDREHGSEWGFQWWAATQQWWSSSNHQLRQLCCGHRFEHERWGGRSGTSAFQHRTSSVQRAFKVSNIEPKWWHLAEQLYSASVFLCVLVLLLLSIFLTSYWLSETGQAIAHLSSTPLLCALPFSWPCLLPRETTGRQPFPGAFAIKGPSEGPLLCSGHLCFLQEPQMAEALPESAERGLVKVTSLFSFIHSKCCAHTSENSTF